MIASARSALQYTHSLRFVLQKWDKDDVLLLLEVALERKDSFQRTKDKVGWYCSLAKEFRRRIRVRNEKLPEEDRVDIKKLHQPSQKRCHDKFIDMTKTCQVCRLF